MISPLTLDDYQMMADHLSLATDVVIDRFTKQQFEEFRVFELKKIIRFFRDLDKFYPNNNPHLRLYGRKSQLVESIISAISYSRQVELAKTTTQESRPDDMTRNYYSSQTQNQMNRYNATTSHRPTMDISLVIQTPSFFGHRSPFYDTNKYLAKTYLLPNKQTLLSFRLAHSERDKIHRSSQNPDFSTLEVHLRLFSTTIMQHVPWDPTFLVNVNGIAPKIPEPKKKSKTKKKGLEIVRALNISAHVMVANTIEVLSRRAAFQQQPFQGIVVAELVNVKQSKELVELMMSRIPGSENLTSPSQSSISPGNSQISYQSPPQAPKECSICQAKDSLLRCSRCKNKWYCSSEHQKQDWPEHRGVCRPPREVLVRPQQPVWPTQPTPTSPTTATNDDDLLEVDSLVSLCCPLSIERMKVAAKGRSCTHQRCFDLETFLLFSNSTDIWQCPLCNKALPWKDLIVDKQMNKILTETPDDCEKIRMAPDGRYSTIRSLDDSENEVLNPPKRSKTTSIGKEAEGDAHQAHNVNNKNNVNGKNDSDNNDNNASSDNNDSKHDNSNSKNKNHRNNNEKDDNTTDTNCTPSKKDHTQQPQSGSLNTANLPIFSGSQMPLGNSIDGNNSLPQSTHNQNSSHHTSNIHSNPAGVSANQARLHDVSLPSPSPQTNHTMTHGDGGSSYNDENSDCGASFDTAILIE